MSFIQVIELETDSDSIEEILANSQRWFDETEGRRTLRREVIARDRNNPDRHLAIVFFDSYESAMVNSQLEETQREAQAIVELGANPTFTDLDVIMEWP